MSLSLTTLAQNNKYPVVVKEGRTLVVKMTKEQADTLKDKVKVYNKTIINLRADSIKAKAKIDSLNQLIALERKKYKSYQASLDTVKKFKERIYDLCSTQINGASGVIIYRRNFSDTTLYMIDLSDYNMVMTSVYDYAPYGAREKITLLPVRKNRRWHVDIPQHQNLGLHMHPHDGIGGNNKKLEW